MFGYNYFQQLERWWLTVETYNIQEYLPHLLGFFPVTTEQGGNDTELWLRDGRKICVPKKTKTVLKDLAQVFAKDLSLVKRQAGQVLGYKRELPLLLTLDLVLIPVKVREASFKDQGTVGYCFYRGVETVQPLKEGRFKSALIFKNEQVLFTLNTVQKLRQKLSEARELLNYESRRLEWLQFKAISQCAEITLEKYHV
jgi:hypothetical protein